jgi:hypothetical protein
MHTERLYYKGNVARPLTLERHEGQMILGTVGSSTNHMHNDLL